MARTTRRTQGHCWGGDRPAGCDWEHHHILCCCSIHLGEGTGSESCQLLVKGEMGNQIPAVAPRDDKPTQVPPPSSASQSSAADLQLCSSVSHTLMPAPSPLYVYSAPYLQALAVVHVSPHSSPLFSWPIYSLPSSQQRGRFLSSLLTSSSPALGGGSPQAGLHQQLTRAQFAPSPKDPPSSPPSAPVPTYLTLRLSLQPVLTWAL